MAWDHVLSNKLSAEQEYTVGSLFCNSDYLETQGFTTLHKTVFGLIPKDLGTELRCSTADIDTPDANGRTPLAWATRRGDIDSIQLLLDYGAKVSVADGQGFLPIHEASTVACARALLSQGADVTSCNAWGRTPLHQACQRGGDVALLDLLLSAGADVNAPDATGETALHTAIVHERTKHIRNEHVAHLMQAGADSSVTNLSGDSPLRFAIMFGTHEILREFLDYPTSFYDAKHIFGHTFAHSIARTADAETLQILESAKGVTLDLNTLDKAGKTALDYVRERSQDPALAAAFDHFARAATRAVSTTSLQRDAKTQQVGSVTDELVVSTIELTYSDDEEDLDENEDSVIYHDAVEDSITVLTSEGSLEAITA